MASSQGSDGWGVVPSSMANNHIPKEERACCLPDYILACMRVGLVCLFSSVFPLGTIG